MVVNTVLCSDNRKCVQVFQGFVSRLKSVGCQLSKSSIWVKSLLTVRWRCCLFCKLYVVYFYELTLEPHDSEDRCFEACSKEFQILNSLFLFHLICWDSLNQTLRYVLKYNSSYSFKNARTQTQRIPWNLPAFIKPRTVSLCISARHTRAMIE